MRCASFCSAESYHIDELSRFLRSEGYEPKFYDDVIHIQKISYSDESRDVLDAFFFPYGCLVTWGMDEDEDQQMLSLVENFQKNPINVLVKDLAFYSINPDLVEEACIDEEEDHMILPSEDHLIKLSFSHALSQSVKLRAFEESISITIQQTRHFPQELAEKGCISLSSEKLAKLMGALFAQRDSMNLDSDILDTPEFFWRRPKYEPFYLRASHYLDIQARVAILNRKLDRVHELYEILSNEHKHIHSSRLECVVIILICIEILCSVLHDSEHLLSLFWRLYPF
jgi:uncharacterized Rmd1/YagE family protein